MSTNFGIKIDAAEEAKTVAFSGGTLDKWRSLEKGFNVEATCYNNECVAYEKNVWTRIDSSSSKGSFPETPFGRISVIDRIAGDVVCPMCNVPTNFYEDRSFETIKGQKEFTNVRSIGLSACKYYIQGKTPDFKQIDTKSNPVTISGSDFKKFKEEDVIYYYKTLTFFVEKI